MKSRKVSAISRRIQITKTSAHYMADESYTVAGKTMPEISVFVGLVFAIWGIGAYIATDMVSLTAMIPAFAGAPIGIMGFLTMKMPERHKTFMHIAAMFGLICALGGLRLFQLLMGGEDRMSLISSHALLLVLGGVYTYFCVQSFIWVRKQRESAEHQQSSA